MIGVSARYIDTKQKEFGGESVDDTRTPKGARQNPYFIQSADKNKDEFVSFKCCTMDNVTHSYSFMP